VAMAFSLGGDLANLGTLPLATRAPLSGPDLVNEPIKPIPTEQKLDARKVELGRQLFHERRLSQDNTISCATCHELDKGGTDRLPRSAGIHRGETPVNSPTVFNAALNFRQLWDGRAATLEEQVDSPLLSPLEMGTTWEAVLGKLRAAPEYVAAFAKLYPEGLQPPSVRDALAQFERSLVTPNSRFDQYLRGDAAVLTADEREGYRKFKVYGCTSCHQGVNVGGNMFEILGGMADYFAERGNVTVADYGRFNVTGQEEDRFVFKVPGLRNVALTAPYFHDGSAARLEDAVAAMGKYQLGRRLSPDDVDQIVAFLCTLTGEYRGKPL